MDLDQNKSRSNKYQEEGPPRQVTEQGEAAGARARSRRNKEE